MPTGDPISYMQVIDGRKIAAEIVAGLKTRPVPKRFFAAFLIGDDPASLSFVNQKKKVARALGADFRLYQLPADITNDAARRAVSKVALSKRCGGALVQLPLPAHLNRHYVLNAIPREKDVDVLGERALGAFYAGRNPVAPPAVGATEKILKARGFDPATAAVAVVGLGLLVGRPVATRLMGRTKELFLLDSSSDFSILPAASLVISGVGKAGLIRPGALADGAAVIDFGYDEAGNSMAGDLDASDAAALGRLSWYTPTPGGTGPVLVAQLMENFYTLNNQ